jgi:60 kDa SS-A/Ro ribonucleoprotein
MSVNYAAQFQTRRVKTPQSKPIPGSSQVKNNAGGYTWELTPWQRLDRFLVLGAEGGTYYVGESKLIDQNHNSVLSCLKESGSKTVKAIVDVSTSGRAYKNDPAIFALALAFTHGDEATRAEAGNALPAVCRTGTHLFSFANYTSAMRGWGRGLRKAVARWYTSKDNKKLAYQLIKYQQRDGWSHADLLRLAHPKTQDTETSALFRYVLDGWSNMEPSANSEREIIRKVNGKQVKASYTSPGRSKLPDLIWAFEEAKTANEKRLVKLIVDFNLPREAIPTDKLKSLVVWEALLHKMPLTALLRNLGKMTNLRLISPLSEASREVVAKLSDAEALRKARIHPMGVLLALNQYAYGRGLKGDLAWSPVTAVIDALDRAFYATFKNVVPCNKPLLLALDVSGSMDGNQILGTCITARQASAAMALVTAATEPNYEIIAFSAASGGFGGKWGGGTSGITQVNISPSMRLDSVIKALEQVPMGGTDCALPILWAAKNKVNVGGFVVYTDNETWAGNVHPQQALRDYRNQFVRDARSVVVGMVSTPFTIADPNDRFALDVVGFDASCPALISDFMRDSQPVKAEIEEEEP